MDMTDDDKQTLKNAVELLWKKGTHHPQEAAVAFKFTQLVEKVIAPEQPKEQMLKNVPPPKAK